MDNIVEILVKYPEIGGYIPRSGEFVRWGVSGHAIVTQSPFDELDGPLMVISLNSDEFTPVEVKKSWGMGPYKLSLEEQMKLPEYYDTKFNKRFSRLITKHVWVYKLWKEYLEKKQQE